MLERNIKRVNWKLLSCNPNAIHILEKNQDKIEWVYLSSNVNAIELLEKNKDKICFETFVMNENPKIINILKQFPEKFKNFYHNLVKNKNPEIVEFFIKNKFYTYNSNNYLSQNPHAFNFLSKHPELINWNGLSINPNAIDFLEQNQHNINKTQHT